VLVPAMVHILHMDSTWRRELAFILLPPIGLGALREYWKAGNVDLRAGNLCAVGMTLGAYIAERLRCDVDATPEGTIRRISDVFGSAAVDEGAALATCRGVGYSKRGRRA